MAKLYAVAAVALAVGYAGCARESSTDETTTLPSTTIPNAPVIEHTAPSGWPQTSAAYPTGWADQAERRQAEIDFAGGESPVLPPNAIGGGPRSFDM